MGFLPEDRVALETSPARVKINATHLRKCWEAGPSGKGPAAVHQQTLTGIGHCCEGSCKCQEGNQRVGLLQVLIAQCRQSPYSPVPTMTASCIYQDPEQCQNA